MSKEQRMLLRWAEEAHKRGWDSVLWYCFLAAMTDAERDEAFWQLSKEELCDLAKSFNSR